MKDLYKEIVLELSQGREIILATLIHQKGSAPRGQGTQFFIRADGTFLGTIGGGRLEAEVLNSATSVFREKVSRLLSFRLKGEEVAETEMICGGEVDIYLEPFSGLNLPDRELFQKVLEVRDRGRTALLATLVQQGLSSDQPDRKVLLRPEDKTRLEKIPWLKSLLQENPRILEDQPKVPWIVLTTQEGRKILMEQLSPPPHLYIFGAGHISLYLCTLCKMVGFRVTLFDDRADFANPRRFPEADAIEVRPFEEILTDHVFDPGSYLVIVTRGHLYDYQIIRRVLGNNHRYIGMIGSRHKRQVVFKSLAQEGFSEIQIRSIHSPIGLDIHAETPEEIAVAITAELVRVRGEERKEKQKTGLSPLDPPEELRPPINRCP
jgi:xanthine dehydrogenase accessory factor